MNLRQAIETGAQRVKRRANFRMAVRLMDPETKALGDEYAACALGAAYLGCHPEVSPEEVARNEDSVVAWAEPKLRQRFGRVMHTNDALSIMGERDPETQVLDESTIDVDADWAALFDKLGQDEGLLDTEVC